MFAITLTISNRLSTIEFFLRILIRLWLSLKILYQTHNLELSKPLNSKEICISQITLSVIGDETATLNQVNLILLRERNSCELKISILKPLPLWAHRSLEPEERKRMRSSCSSAKSMEGGKKLPQNNRKRCFYDRMRHQNICFFSFGWLSCLARCPDHNLLSLWLVNVSQSPRSPFRVCSECVDRKSVMKHPDGSFYESRGAVDRRRRHTSR